MALSGLSTGNCAAIVKEFRVAGAWRDGRKEDYIKGRVPDDAMLLSIVMRNAIDKMTNLKSFRSVLVGLSESSGNTDAYPAGRLTQSLSRQSTKVWLL